MNARRSSPRTQVRSGNDDRLWGSTSQNIIENPRNVPSLTPGAIFNLVATGKTICRNNRLAVCIAYRGQQRELGHGHRLGVGFLLIAKASGHAAATGLDDLRLQSIDKAKRVLNGIHGTERLLVTVAMQE